MEDEKKSLYWKLCIAGVVLLSILTFTPIVMPQGVADPELLGVPRTLWASILTYIGIVILTYIGTKVYPGAED
jgi:hypothetical protein